MHEPRAILFKNPPKGWTAPKKYAQCRIHSEHLMTNDEWWVRLDCPESIVEVEKVSKVTRKVTPL